MLYVKSSQGDMRVAAATRLNTPAVRTVTLVVDPAAVRGVHAEIAQRLRRMGVQVSIAHAHAAEALPASVELVLRLERMLGRARIRLCAPHELSALELPPATHDADLTIDFSGKATTKGRVLRVLYDDAAGESCLMGALFAGQMPSVALQDSSTGEIVGRAFPGTEDASTISAALEGVYAGLATLIVNVVGGWGNRIDKQVGTARPPALSNLAKLKLKGLAHAALRRIYVLCCHTPHWRVCWRHVDGLDLWDTRTLEGTAWQVLPDPGTHFYADPFPVTHQGRSYVFVEDLDHRTNKGVISVIPFDETGPTGPARVVLEEAWHLSYPFVFERDGQMWMIPESSANNSITLYRAERFPDAWVKEADLVTGTAASDATLVDHGGKLWMFASTWSGAGSYSDTLSIYHANALNGPWTAHDGNPLLVDQSCMRPAGAFVHRNGRLWRPVQDCRAGYGTGIGLAEVTRLDAGGYAQTLHATVHAPSTWPGRRLHTLNRAGALEVIDGAAHSPRSRLLARHLEEWSGRRDLTN